jgi:excisionase family DNA binding protein
MRFNTSVSTARVAEALGVSVTTVKRWVDERILPARRTPGGHRKVLVADVLRLVKDSDFPHRDLSLLGLRPDGGSALDPAALARGAYTALRTADDGELRRLVHGAYGSGMALEVLGDEVLGPALTRIGGDWEAGRIDVLHEHRASQACAACLYELRARLEPSGARTRPVAVGGVAEQDPAVLPSLLAQLALLDAGWQAVNLGPQTPLASFRTALTELRPRLVWVSVTHPLSDSAAFAWGCQELARVAEQQGTVVMVGGRALPAELLPADLPLRAGRRLGELVALARSLCPRPARPRRGRPRGARKS